MLDIYEAAEVFYQENCAPGKVYMYWTEDEFRGALHAEYPEFSTFEIKAGARRQFMLAALGACEVPQKLKAVIKRVITGE